MAVDVTLLNSNSLANITTNFERVEAALQETLGRGGDIPNEMNGDIDLNNNDLLNVNRIDVQELYMDGVPVASIPAFEELVSIAPEIVAVAGISDDVVAVGSNIADVSLAADNIASIIAAPTAATNAAASAVLAQAWADNPEDVTVVPTKYSALHWAAKAAASAVSAISGIVAAIAGFTTKATPASGDLFGYVQASDTTGRKLTFAELITALFTNANALTGSVVQHGYNQYSSSVNLTAIIPADASIPQITEGTEVLSFTITPRSATNKLRVSVRAYGTSDNAAYLSCALFVNGAANALDGQVVYTAGAGQSVPILLDYEYTPGTVSPQTITIRVGPATGLMRLNGVHTGPFFSGASRAKLFIDEIKA